MRTRPKRDGRGHLRARRGQRDAGLARRNAAPGVVAALDHDAPVPRRQTPEIVSANQLGSCPVPGARSGVARVTRIRTVGVWAAVDLPPQHIVRRHCLATCLVPLEGNVVPPVDGAQAPLVSCVRGHATIAAVSGSRTIASVGGSRTVAHGGVGSCGVRDARVGPGVDSCVVACVLRGSPARASVSACPQRSHDGSEGPSEQAQVLRHDALLSRGMACHNARRWFGENWAKAH